MVLFSFSVLSMIPDILSGKKAQTTRIPRKPRANGKKPYSVGEKVQLYYRSRQANQCYNCIQKTCPYNFGLQRTSLNCFKHSGCDQWSNFFGESVITEIIHFRDNHKYFQEHGYLPGGGISYECFGNQNEAFMESWAKADGFADLQEAHKWFVKSTGKELWMFDDWDVIKWKPPLIARRMA